MKEKYNEWKNPNPHQTKELSSLPFQEKHCGIQEEEEETLVRTKKTSPHTFFSTLHLRSVNVKLINDDHHHHHHSHHQQHPRTNTCHVLFRISIN